MLEPNRVFPVIRACILSLVFSGVLVGCAATGPKSEEETAVEPTAKLLAAADEAARTGKLEAALTLYGNVLHKDPTAATWFKAGRVHVRLRNDREAVFAFSRVLELEPEHADAHEQLGLLYVARELTDPARTHFERAVALDPKRWRSYNGLGVIADLERDYASAAVHYRRALDARPNSAMLMSNLGYSLYLSGDLDGAATEFVSAMSVDPGYTPARRNLGLLYARKGAYGDAVEVLATVMSEASAYNDVGYIALLRDDYEAAERLLVEAVDRSATYNETAARNLALARERLRDPSSASRQPG